MDVREPSLVLASGHLIARGLLARLEHGGAFAWLAELRRSGPALVPAEAAPSLVETMAQSNVEPSRLPDRSNAIPVTTTGVFPGSRYSRIACGIERTARPRRFASTRLIMMRPVAPSAGSDVAASDAPAVAGPTSDRCRSSSRSAARAAG